MVFFCLIIYERKFFRKVYMFITPSWSSGRLVAFHILIPLPYTCPSCFLDGISSLGSQVRALPRLCGRSQPASTGTDGGGHRSRRDHWVMLISWESRFRKPWLKRIQDTSPSNHYKTKMYAYLWWLKMMVKNDGVGWWFHGFAWDGWMGFTLW